MEKEPQRWINQGSKLEADCRIFKVNRTTFLHEGRGTSNDFFVMDTPDWVHVVALNKDGELVMVQQFRFGNEKLSWEVPGGLMEPGESPIEAARRELREETGYTSEDARVIAAISPNPAIQSNTCYFVLIRDAEKTVDLEWDEHEEILCKTLPVETVEDWAHSGKIFHSLSITSLFYLKKYL